MNNNRMIAAALTRARSSQRGVALYVVLVLVMLSVLLVLWASRTALFSEIVVGNDADYQRAFEAAQALLQDAELDIRGQTAAGTPCVPSGGSVCRPTAPAQIPLEDQNVGALITTLQAQSTHCLNALCAKLIGRQDFWDFTGSFIPAPPADAALGENPLNTMTPVGARYGQYTGARLGTASAPINPILTNASANAGGWYWIEVLPYDNISSTSLMVSTAGAAQAQLLPLNLSPSVAYRITALAYGIKPSTMVVLQETYVQQKLKD